MIFPRNFSTSHRVIIKRLLSNIKNESNIMDNATIKRESIVIPKRIQRSPTDILRALAATVGYDPTAPHYKYHDDPYLIPMSNVTKHTYAMAQESGRKAAMWIKEQHRDLFMHQEADPPIDAFAPKMVFDENSEVTQKTLDQLINCGELNDAVFVYQLMKAKNINITDDIKQKLLEIICFYNNEEPTPIELYEEYWFKENNEKRIHNRIRWKDGELAEQLYDEIEPKTTKTYSALIRGMAKYNQAARAYSLYQEALEKQLQLDANTFNSVISIVHFLKETADQRWDLCVELLQQMNQQQVHPNLSTLNALLECISTFGNYKLARNSALNVLTEFKKLNIKPSLGSYYFVLIIFCRDRAPVSHVLADILNEIEGCEFTIQHAKDTYFFTTAMDICRNHLHDISLAKRVDKLLHIGRNYDLIGDTYKENIYYRHYFILLSQTSTIEEFMQTYDLLVPNIYIPEPGVMEEILKMIEMNAAIDLVPRLWSDILIFDYNRESLLLKILKIMIQNKPNMTNHIEQQLPKQFAKIALDIYTKVQDTASNKNKRLSFTGHMIGDILTLLTRGDNYEAATQVFNYIDKNQHRIPGTPNENCLKEYIELCITKKSPTQALLCLEYATENQMDSMPLAELIHKSFTLSEEHLSKIKSIMGDAFSKM